MICQRKHLLVHNYAAHNMQAFKTKLLLFSNYVKGINYQFFYSTKKAHEFAAGITDVFLCMLFTEAVLAP
jgi:hypothetical protein